MNGWAAEAVLLFFNYLFAYFDLRKAQLEVFAFNQYLLAPLTEIGVRVEGRFLAQRYYQGRYHDVVRLAVLHEEWDSHGPALLRHLLAGSVASPKPNAADASEAALRTELEPANAATESTPLEPAAEPARKPKRGRSASANGVAPAPAK
jgi:hypothetical protein